SATDDGFDSEFVEISFDPAKNDVTSGQNLTLGVRPEDVYLARDREEADNPTHTIDAKVDVLEPMGDEVFAYLLLGEDVEASAEGRGEGQLLLNLDPQTDVEEGQDIEVVYDQRNIHLFDTDTEEAITHRVV
ncbi:MAG: TOBE domain-containing protein, partial [Halapricum sp.]